MADVPEPQRCRLVLIAPDQDDAAVADLLESALAGGDVASVILPRHGADEDRFQTRAERCVPLIQEAGAAAVLEGDLRIAMRTGADGVHVGQGRIALEEIAARNGGRLILGAGGVKTRHEALELGEAQPDYMFFGRFGYDNRAEPHPRNLGLAQWWAEMVEIPCIVLGGNTLASVVPVAQTGAEFAALSSAVWTCADGPAAAVRKANELLEAAGAAMRQGRSDAG